MCFETVDVGRRWAGCCVGRIADEGVFGEEDEGIEDLRFEVFAVLEEAGVVDGDGAGFFGWAGLFEDTFGCGFGDCVVVGHGWSCGRFEGREMKLESEGVEELLKLELRLARGGGESVNAAAANRVASTTFDDGCNRSQQYG